MAVKKKEASTKAKKTPEQDLISSEYLRKVFAEADASLEHFLNLKKLYDKQGKSGDQFKNNFLSFIQRALDLLKILNLMTNAPLGLTKGQIGQYVMADKYKGKVESAEKEKQKIMKNLNSIEKNIAHLSALLYMFFPNHRDALSIVRDEEKTQGKAFRYRFNDFETARRIFSDLARFDDELAFTQAITEKTRNEISENCIEDVAKELTEYSSEKSEKKEHYRKLLNRLSKAIAEHNLCEIEIERNSHRKNYLELINYYGEDDDSEENVQSRYSFLPLMIRDVAENAFDRLYSDVNYSSMDKLYKYLNMDAEFIVQGLIFKGKYKGRVTEDEWFRNAESKTFRLSSIRSLKLKDKLADGKGELAENDETRLKLSSNFNFYTGELFRLNLYRNLCNEDFYLLLPTDFLNRLPSAIKRTCLIFEAGENSPENAAQRWINQCKEYLSYDYSDSLGILKFNFDYFDANAKYSLVKCPNYLELIQQLNLYHISLPDSTLPREIVDRQSLMFTRSMISRNLLASPHQKLHKEKEVLIRHELIDDADEVFKESETTYSLNKRNAYLSKFGYTDLETLEFCYRSFSFCRSMCDISMSEDDTTQNAVGIPLCISEENGINYLIYWDYEPLVKKLSALKQYKREDDDYRDTEVLNIFVRGTGLREEKILKISEDLSLDFKCVKLNSVDSFFNFGEPNPEDPGTIELSMLDIDAASILKEYVKAELKPNPKLDELTDFKRNYVVFFDKNAYRDYLYIPDSFYDAQLFTGIDDFENFHKIPAKAKSLFNRLQQPYQNGEPREILFLSFSTTKRSDVVRFLHEHMGRVFYLDMSEDSSDPLRIYEELKADNEKLKSVCDLK